eukprot:scaffold652_cov142-Skeletonema_menzelii.AAC.1
MIRQSVIIRCAIADGSPAPTVKVNSAARYYNTKNYTLSRYAESLGCVMIDLPIDYTSAFPDNS